MPLYTKRLGNITLTSSYQTFHTSPAGTTTRVSHIIFSCITEAVINLKIQDSSGTDIFLIKERTIPAGDNIELFDIVLNPEDDLIAKADNSADVDVVCFGVEQT